MGTGKWICLLPYDVFFNFGKLKHVCILAVHAYFNFPKLQKKAIGQYRTVYMHYTMGHKGYTVVWPIVRSTLHLFVLYFGPSESDYNASDWWGCTVVWIDDVGKNIFLPSRYVTAANFDLPRFDQYSFNH